jgi:CPA2 family monovalent cation:H+ antiporter-2
MPHDTPLISTIVAGLVLAFIFGAIANRFKMPPLVGYLVAGVFVGPFTPGFVANAELAGELSEIGVILLMFGVGLHFSLKDLLSVRAIAIPGALVQIAGATAMGLGLGLLMGWTLLAGLIFGLALSVASTVVLLKALQDRHIVESERGRIAVGWLIVEDIAMVLALVLIPALAGLSGAATVELHDPFINVIERLSGLHLNLWAILGLTVVKLAAFVGFMLVVGRRVIPWILHFTAHTGSRELFRLAVLAIALGVAAGAAYLFGVSLALGAFFAGMILSESELSNRAAQESLPFRDAFAVLFFVSVGMLFDPSILIRSPLPVLATVLIIIVGKSVLSFIITTLFRQPVGTGLTISASLAQIGEFSFILAALGVGLGILPPGGRDLILAGALISIVLNPVIFYMAEHLRPRFEARQATVGELVVPQRVEPALSETSAGPAAVIEEPIDERHPTRLSGHVVLIGYGRVGSVVADGLKHAGTPFLLIEDAENRIAAAQQAGIEVVVGNAASGNALVLANVAQANALLIAIPNAFEAGQAVEQAHKLNPSLRIIARAHSDEEDSYLKELGAVEVIMGEREIGLGMLGWIGMSGAAATPEPAPRVSSEPAPTVSAMGFDNFLVTPVPVAPEPLAELVATDHVAPEPPADVLEAEIEAAHPEHFVSGPAEPPELVPAFGEMLDERAAGTPALSVAETADAIIAAAEPPAPPLVVVPPPPPRPRAATPATRPATPFNPEVVPAED